MHEQRETNPQVEELCQRLQDGLRRELDRRHGQIGTAEARIGRSAGYLRRLASGRWQPSIDALFEAVLGLGMDPSTFLEHSLDLTPKPESVLLSLEAEAREDGELRVIERALRTIETGDRSTEPMPANVTLLDEAACQREIEALGKLSRSEQRRRLRTKKALRQAAFVERFITHLDLTRHDAPTDTIRLAVPLLTVVIPACTASRTETLRLACDALGVLGAAYRHVGEMAHAARTLRAGLEMTERNGMELQRARLLRRVAVVLEAYGEYDRGLSILREAAETYHDYNDREGFAAVLVARGVLLSRQKRYQRANRVLVEAEAFFLTRASSVINRHYLTAIYQRLSANLLETGSLDESRGYIRKARILWNRAGGFVYAQLLWQNGILARDAGHLDASAEYLREADEIVDRTENLIERVHLKLELATTLSMLGRSLELEATVRSALPLAARVKDNKGTAEALREFLTLGMSGNRSEPVLRKLAERAGSRHDLA